MKKIIFLHGFFSSGSCPLAQTLQRSLAEEAEVLAPDLPLHPHAALEQIRTYCREEEPDLLVGNSCGAFYAQILSGETAVPALLGNPHFKMTAFLRDRIGDHSYKAPRKDGKQTFHIDSHLIEEFDEIQQIQFANYQSDKSDRIWGLFGTQDTLAHFEPLFLKYYPQVFHFPGNHTPTPEEVKAWYVPLIRKMLDCFSSHS